MTNHITKEPNKTFDNEMWNALYDGGYVSGVGYAINIIDNCLEQEELDRIPASWMLKVIKHTLQQGE